MGLVSSGDVWCQRSDQAFEGHKGTLKIVDDGITGGRDIAELRERLVKVFESCKKHSLTLSRKKFQIGREVKFAGHVIGADGVKPDPDKVKAYRNGKKGLLGFFMGEVMRNSRGKADPKATSKMLAEKL